MIKGKQIKKRANNIRTKSTISEKSQPTQR